MISLMSTVDIVALKCPLRLPRNFLAVGVGVDGESFLLEMELPVAIFTA